MLKILPCSANQVSVQPPLSQIRMGAALLMILNDCRAFLAFVAHLHSNNDREQVMILRAESTWFL